MNTEIFTEFRKAYQLEKDRFTQMTDETGARLSRAELNALSAESSFSLMQLMLGDSYFSKDSYNEVTFKTRRGDILQRKRKVISSDAYKKGFKKLDKVSPKIKMGDVVKSFDANGDLKRIKIKRMTRRRQGENGKDFITRAFKGMQADEGFFYGRNWRDDPEMTYKVEDEVVYIVTRIE